MPKTIRELADEFGVSKQAIRKKLAANFSCC
ncbi:helix-turn-helix domain-containing protein (plasmid) [Pediococcus inopinatus]|nr:HTH domain-containing protein [Lactiplantibacillus paraplantarum]WPC18599.1 helix-turn-helix domain-containing protein [Pediococcus inopinatus]